MGNFVLKIPQHKLRVVAPDVGGGFGVKQFHYAEEAVVTWASTKLGRPVKWVCERSEGFISDAHGRDHVTEAELGLDATGRFLALRVRTIANMGGYLSTFGPNIPSYLYGPLLAGVYTTPAIYCEVKQSLPTPYRLMLTVERVGRKRLSFLSDSWTLQQGRWGSIELKSAAKTRFQKAHTLTKLLSWLNMTVATR